MKQFIAVKIIVILSIAFFGDRSSASVVVNDAGWVLTNTLNVTNPQAAHYNPIDGLVYFGKRSGLSGDGLYRINHDGTTTKIADGISVAAVTVNHSTGDIFFTEDGGDAGHIYKVDYETHNKETWDEGFDGGDDDPVGMDISGADGWVVDRGSPVGPDEIWHFSPGTKYDEWEILKEDEPLYIDSVLLDPVDIAVGFGGIYIVDDKNDSDGVIYRLDEFSTLNPVYVTEAIADPVGIAIDPLTGDLLILDYAGNRLVRVDLVTGNTTNMFSGFNLSQRSWAGVDITPDGKQIFITDAGFSKIYTFSSVPIPGAAILFSSSLMVIIGFRRKLKK